jgi:hypothetical protein
VILYYNSVIMLNAAYKSCVLSGSLLNVANNACMLSIVLVIYVIMLSVVAPTQGTNIVAYLASSFVTTIRVL